MIRTISTLTNGFERNRRYDCTFNYFVASFALYPKKFSFNVGDKIVSTIFPEWN